MTTLETTTLIPVLTHNGFPIPARGSICFHPALGFGEVVTRSGSRLRIAITEPVDGSVSDSLSAVSSARASSAEIEIAGLEARMADKEDAFHGAKALVNGMIEGLIARCTEDNECIVNIDGAEGFGWEFDTFAMEQPKRATKKASAPKPVVARKAEVVELEDDTRPDWIVAEMNACFGDQWIPNAQA